MAKSNIATVVSFEVVRTLRTRVFWVGSLLGPVFMAVLIGVLAASNSSAADSLGAQTQTFSFEWVDESGLVNADIATSIGGTQITDPAQGVADVKAGKVQAFFQYPKDPTTSPILVSAQDLGILDSQQFPGLASEILRQSAVQDVNNSTLVSLVSGSIPTQLTTYKDGVVTPGVWGMILPLVLIAVFFIIVVMQGNRMLTALLEEKENRVTEMILTTIKPTQLLTGKVAALGVIGVVQVLVIVVPTIIVGLVLDRAGMMPTIDLSKLVFEPVPMILGILMLLGGFLLFTCSLVAIGAAMPTVRDAQGMFATVILLLIVPIYLIMWMLTNPGNVIVQVFTFFPWTAPITAMARNALGMLPWWQGAIVVVVLFAAAYLVFLVAARLFQYGSVEYSKKIDVRSALRTTSK
ncbi:MAG: ABC transporter permease [Propionibacteriaceae bacterium]|nr:ABC transporter permease [Propionibacteriaceae bacterium]